jgi:hypothetical protein
MLPDIALTENAVVEEYRTEENECDYQECSYCDNVGKNIADKVDLSHEWKMASLCQAVRRRKIGRNVITL